MAYIKTTWEDRLVERPNTFEVQENPDGEITVLDLLRIHKDIGGD